MSEPIKTRPPQVTMASGLVVVSSVVVVLSAFAQVASLGSLETQRAIDEALASAPFGTLDLDAAGLTSVARVLAIVSAVTACATGILGWYVRHPDRGARLALTIFSVPVFVAGLSSAWLPTTGIAGSFVAAGAAMLWMVPAREWFATGRWTPPPSREATAARQARPQQPWQPTPPTAQPGRPAHPPTQPLPAARPFGEHHPVAPPSGQPYAPPYAPYAPHQPARPATPPTSHDRPGGVVAAFVVTVVVAGGLLTFSLLWVAMVALSPELLMSAYEQQQPGLVEAGLSVADLRRSGFGVGGALIVWCGVALVLAGFLMARRDWARRGLLVLAGLSAAASLLFVVVSAALAVFNPLLVVPGAAAVAVVACLRRADVRRWSATRAR